MSGFYVDADDQRARARRAEQRLRERDQNRPIRPRAYDPSDDTAESSLPPVFRKEGYYAAGRDTSVERRAARFRDGLPPPPPPTFDQIGEIPRLLPPSLPALVPPDQFGMPAPTGQVVPGYPPTYQDRPPLPEPPEPQYRLTAQGLVPYAPLPPEVQPRLSAPVPPNGLAPLTPSQKKRLRRKRKREADGTAGLTSPRPAPFPLAVDLQTNGYGLPSAVFPTHPEITQTRCEAEVLVRMPNGSTHRLVCPLQPFPHPNQPHMIQLPSAQQDGAEIFIGFWMPGE